MEFLANRLLLAKATVISSTKTMLRGYGYSYNMPYSHQA